MKSKKIVFIIILLSFSISITTCKKISKYPIRLNGVWYAPLSPCGALITINENGFGHHESTEDRGGCGNAGEKGKVRFTKNKFYIGITSYKIISQPTIYYGNDSVLLPGRFHTNVSINKVKILANMTLKDNFFNSGKTYTYYKIIEY